MKKKRLAIIGCGNIANFHVPALKAVGLSISHCASSKDSNTINNFALLHKINNVWNDPFELIKKSELWDGLVITSSVETTFDLLKMAIKSNKPILIEKPVSINSIKLKKFSKVSPQNVMVGYNRRYYSTIQIAKNFILNKKFVRASMELPEKVSSNLNDPYYYLRVNSTHGVDILNYLFNGVKIEYSTTASFSNPFFGRNAILRSSKGHLIDLKLNWNSPANFSLSLDDSKQRLHLSPLEKFILYEGIKIKLPTKNYPIRQYLPKKIDDGSVFDSSLSDFKPGFFQQAKEFRNLIEGKSPSIGATLTDAYNAMKMIERII